MDKRFCTKLFRTAVVLGAALTTFEGRAEAQGPTSVGLGGHAFQQVALTSTDLARAIAFYRDTLGLTYAFESNNMVFFDVGGTRLMIALDPARERGRPASIFYFDAPEFEESLERLKRAPVQLVGEVETVQRTAEGELKLQQFEDPDGNMLAIMGMVSTKR